MIVPLTWQARSADRWTARWSAPDSTPLTMREAFEALATDAGARAMLTERLREVRFEAIAWETPPLGDSLPPGIAEFTAVESPRLARVRTDPHPFTEPLSHSTGPIAVFDNLGGDATLVVPRPDGGDYPHLMAFVRTAPDALIDALWRTVAETVLATDRDPVWVSTAGLGVYWLHVRLDDRPKYYRHGPYRSVPG